MSIINEMFNMAEESQTTTNARCLQGTALLTSVASELTNKTIATINDSFDEYKEAFEASRDSHSSMDALLTQLIDFAEVDTEFIKELDEATVTGMLKSQQSKRSRAKSKQKTFDNYKTMMTAAIAELIIRTATGKEKSAGGARRAAGPIEFSEERLQELKADQEQLKKEIRNIQSKKSIMKSKADFSEDSDRWIELLTAEQQLKELRDSSSVHVVKVDETKEKLAEVLGTVDTDSIKAADSKKLLETLKSLLQ